MINQKRLRIKKKYGFTLIEILISLAIVATTAVMLTQNVSQSYTTYQDTQDIVKSSDLAQKYMEQVKANLRYATVYDSVTSGSTPPIPITSIYTDSGYYNVTTNVANLDTAIVNGSTVTILKEVTISYFKANLNTPLARFSTIISRPEN